LHQMKNGLRQEKKKTLFSMQSRSTKNSRSSHEEINISCLAKAGKCLSIKCFVYLNFIFILFISG